MNGPSVCSAPPKLMPSPCSRREVAGRRLDRRHEPRLADPRSPVTSPGTRRSGQRVLQRAQRDLAADDGPGASPCE